MISSQWNFRRANVLFSYFVLNHQVSTSPTFHKQLFVHFMVFFTALLYWQSVFVIFWLKKLVKKQCEKCWWNWLQESILPNFFLRKNGKNFRKTRKKTKKTFFNPIKLFFRFYKEISSLVAKKLQRRNSFPLFENLRRRKKDTIKSTLEIYDIKNLIHSILWLKVLVRILDFWLVTCLNFGSVKV